MRTLRPSLAIVLLAVLLVQSLVALTAPREARAGGRPPVILPAPPMVEQPQRFPPAEPTRYVPADRLPNGDKDPRHC